MQSTLTFIISQLLTKLKKRLL